VKPARSRDAGNTMLSKEFAGGILIMTGANSAVGLRSTPARYIFLDEVDAYPASADEEGDPVSLAEARSLIPDRERDEWVRLEIESNPLPICTRPQVLRSARRT
jgi:phage terminase large subunit GpA-like protein